MRVACLHTAASNIAVFDDAARDAAPGLMLSHLVVPQWLAEAEEAGGMTAGQRVRLGEFIQALTPFFDAILITCSTLGAVTADFPRHASSCRVVRSDEMLANAVSVPQGKTVVLCAAPSTVEATSALFGLPAERIGGAWDAFKTGNSERYITLIADAVSNALDQGAQQVVLAQVSMAPAARLFPGDKRVKVIPEAALKGLLSL